MSQGTGLIQQQKEAMLQKLTPQQLLQVRLIEMPITDLEQHVKDEIENNEALEEGRDKSGESNDDGLDNLYDGDEGGEETEEQIQKGDYSSEDDIPDYLNKQYDDTEYKESQPIGDTVTFHDDLMDQMVNYDLTEHQQELIEYLIGSLDDNGFLDQSLERMEDEMLFNHNIETDADELREVLHILQQFDPAGIGARNSQESLLIQIDRMLEDEKISDEKAKLLRLERRIVADEYENFKNANMEKISQNLSVELNIIKYAVKDMTKSLNPRPGRALCESSSDRIQTATPDFIVETDGEGGVSFRLNRGDLPMLHINEEYKNLVKKYQNKGEKLSRHDKEGLTYYKQKIDSAQGFIDAIRQRQETLTKTMRVIISKQKDFFLSQDDEDLCSLIYKDVADAAKMDISTVSRVCRTKYALVDGRMYLLTHFFKHNRKNSEGEEVQRDKVADAIRFLVENEDKKHPYTDDMLVDKLKEMNISIARRTVNQYRKVLAIPTAQQRKA